MLCLVSNNGVDFTVATSQPVEFTSCVYLLAQPQDLAINAWALTASQGIELASSIGLLWATAYTFRVLGQFLRSKSNQNESEN